MLALGKEQLTVNHTRWPKDNKVVHGRRTFQSVGSEAN